MTAIIPFTFEGLKVRAFSRDGTPWFVLADICRALGLASHKGSYAAHAEKLDPDEKKLADRDVILKATPVLNLGVAGTGLKMLGSIAIDATDPLAHDRSAWLVNEPGLYTLILRCREATTKGTLAYRFRKWVTADVLPTLRRTGRYEVGIAGSEPPSIQVTDEDLRKRLMVLAHLRTFGPLKTQLYWKAIGLATVDLPSDIPDQPGLSALRLAERWKDLAAEGMTPATIAAASGVTPRSVQYSLRMIERLIEPAKRALEEGKITPFQARHMCAGTEEQQGAILTLLQSGFALTGDDIAERLRK